METINADLYLRKVYAPLDPSRRESSSMSKMLQSELADTFEEATKTKEVPIASGVYALFEGDVCIYIGSSINMCARVDWHRVRKVFDKIWYWRIPEDKMMAFEKILICEVQPILNRILYVPTDGNPKPIFILPSFIQKRSSLCALQKEEKWPIIKSCRRFFRRNALKVIR